MTSQTQIKGLCESMAANNRRSAERANPSKAVFVGSSKPSALSAKKPRSASSVETFTKAGRPGDRSESAAAVRANVVSDTKRPDDQLPGNVRQERSFNPHSFTPIPARAIK